MEIGGWAGRLIQAGDWMVRLCCLNGLWILFTLLGFGIFGLFPATVGVFAVIRKWRTTSEEVPLFRTFWRLYRSSWVESNLLMIGFALMGWALAMDFRLVRMLDGPMLFMAQSFLIAASAVTFVALLYLFPVVAHFRLTVGRYVLQSFLLVLARPAESLGMAAVAVLCVGLFQFLPGALPFFGISLPAYLLMRIALRAFWAADSRSASSRGA